MQLGLLTARFPVAEWPLERIISWAGENGFDCLEVLGPGHLDPRKLLAEKGQAALREKLRAAGVTLSSLAYYSVKITDPDPAVRKEEVGNLLATIEAAASLELDTVCTLAGFPLPDKSKLETIREELPDIFGPVLAKAQGYGIRIALENYFRTNIQHLDHWRALFEVLPQENFGLNFDPSHLDLMEIDYLGAVAEFADRIFHTHAKDVVVNQAQRRRLGIFEERGWWRFSIPGTGRIAWGEYLGALREIGFDGAVSIEHEDKTLGPEAGFQLGARQLRPLLAAPR